VKDEEKNLSGKAGVSDSEVREMSDCTCLLLKMRRTVVGFHSSDANLVISALRLAFEWWKYRGTNQDRDTPAESKQYAAQIQGHREEIARFTAAVHGAEVGFGVISYREWLASWPDVDSELVGHRAAIIKRFQP
jgi:hypothetical protein